MSIDRDQLGDALVDVRKAYRIVHAYQQRLWHLFRTIDHILGSAGLSFKGWYPMRYCSPPKSKTKFFVDRWAWDFLPAFEIGCEWEEKAGTRKFVRRVFIIAAADSGYRAPKQGEPDSNTFEPAEKTRSEIRVGLWTASSKSPNWGEAWEKLDDDAHSGAMHTLCVKGVNYTYKYFCLDIAELVNEAAVKARLLELIELWLKTAESESVQ